MADILGLKVGNVTDQAVTKMGLALVQDNAPQCKTHNFPEFPIEFKFVDSNSQTTVLKDFTGAKALFPSTWLGAQSDIVKRAWLYRFKEFVIEVERAKLTGEEPLETL